MDKPSLTARALALFQKHRRRLATLSLLVFLAMVAVEIGGALPRETRVSVPLGARHAQVTEARIDYTQDNAAVHSVTLRWPEGAPESVRHTLDLTPGEYEVAVVLLEREGERRALRGRLEAPADGVVRLALHPDEGG